MAYFAIKPWKIKSAHDTFASKPHFSCSAEEKHHVIFRNSSQQAVKYSSKKSSWKLAKFLCCWKHYTNKWNRLINSAWPVGHKWIHNWRKICCIHLCVMILTYVIGKIIIFLLRTLWKPLFAKYVTHCIGGKQSLFIHPHVVPNLYDFFSFMKHKCDCLKNILATLFIFSIMKVNGIWKCQGPKMRN